MTTGQGETRLLPSTIKREALIRISDTVPDGPFVRGAPPIYDFDEALSAQVRNGGNWIDEKFPIGRWTDAGTYAAELLPELRQEQRRLYGVFEQFDRTHLPDAQVLKQSLGRTVVAVINYAPRLREHHESDQNGADFYLAELDNNLQIFSQLPYLRGIATRGLVRSLWRVRDDNPIWPKGEQFRSSIVAQLRNFPEGLEATPLEHLPCDTAETLLLAYGDKYGNSRIKVPPTVDIPEIVKGQKFGLIVDGKPPLEVIGATRLTGIPEGQLGIYVNPADADTRYLELARSVPEPNDPRNSAYEALRSAVLPESQEHPDWTQVSIELVA